jgi:uncharacterized repeat protein (TIGR01451 family)
MGRTSLAVIGALVVSNSLAAFTWGQSTSRPATLAERMAALRRGWTQGREESSASDRSEPQSRSFLPNGLLGRRPETDTAMRVPPPSSSDSAAQSVLPPRAGSAQSGSTSSNPPLESTLPGLGGSRLPSNAVAPPYSANAPATDIARELADDPDYPVIRGETPGATASRYSTSPARTAQLDDSAVRRSPQRRAPMHVDPNELQRELVGTFPTTSNDSSKTDSTASASPAAPESVPTESPFALPTKQGEPPTNAPVDNHWVSPDASTSGPAKASKETQPTSSSPAEPQFRVLESPTTGTRGAAPTDSHGDLRAAFGHGAPAATADSNHETKAPAAAGPRDLFSNTKNSGGGDSALLVSQQTPVITTDIRGPRQILVGREATFRVRLENKGSIAAEGIVASVRIPSWADVIDTDASAGTVQPTQSGTAGVLEWQLVRLDTRSAATLDVRLVPRNSRPLELGVSYTVSPVGSRAVVEVQEPKLGIHVSGPDDVLYGKPQVFRLTITNPGTGVAEDVKIDLLPPGGGDAAVSTHPLGDLAAGSSKTVEVELTAREAGKLAVKAHATAEGGLSADADKEIFCRKPELQIDWRGPDQKYAGTQATYYFRVRNPGTAPAEDVTVRVSLPEGAEYAGASEGQTLDAQRREVSWRVGTLGPGDDYYMELKCLVQTPGANQLKLFAATANGDLTDSKLAETNVVALADLKLEVSDPSGPVAVGEEAIYEIRVKNRGTSAAKEINIVALFSAGIEPDQVEGPHSVADGRVTFRTIDELAAGREVNFRIRAHALQAGTHVFRAEVLCRDSEIKLAAEETTRFYADDLPADSSPAEQSALRSQQFDEPQTR